jgi:SAM-dependent methyltransferase
MNQDDVARVAAGYDAVYAAMPRSPAFQRIWREHAIGPGYPEEFEHISFLTYSELLLVKNELRPGDDAVLADLACGLGGPGLWIAKESRANLRGVDVSPVAVAEATRRAEALGLTDRATFTTGTFAATGLDAASCDAAMSVDALQYAPDKQAAFDESARILRSGGRLVFAAFELAPERVAGLPILGTDPVDDYRAALQRAGFDVTSYAETTGWSERVDRAYRAIMDAKGTLTDEMGEAAFAALSSEVTVTLNVRPYRRRVLAAATKR